MKKMTNEKAKECIDAIIGTWEICQNQKYPSAVDVEIDAEDIVALKMSLKALEQDHCTDAISRQAVLEKAFKIAGYDKNAYVVDVADIKTMPSVSTEKTGRWIRWYEVIESADGKSTDHIPHCKCSECNCEYDAYSAQFIKYCQSCGAKMEVEE